MLEKLLEKLGLSDKEARVYLATLELGQDSVQNIAKKAKVVRPTTYVVLEKLLKLGLVSTVTEGKKTKYIAENPKELANLLEEQKRDIDESKKELDENLNQFLAIYNSSGEKPTVRYYEGIEGIVTLDKYGTDIRTKQKGGEILTITPVDILEDVFPERRKEAVSSRVKAGIKARTIYTRKAGDFDSETDRRDLREGIRLDSKAYPFNMTISIYPWGLKLFHLDKNKPYGVLIEDESVAKNLKLFFELAWIGAKKEKTSS